MRLSNREIDALVAQHIMKLHGVDTCAATYLDLAARPDREVRPVPAYTKELEALQKLRRALRAEGLSLRLADDETGGEDYWALVLDATGRIVHAAKDREPARAACVAALMAVRKRRRAFDIPVVEALNP